MEAGFLRLAAVFFRLSICGLSDSDSSDVSSLADLLRLSTASRTAGKSSLALPKLPAFKSSTTVDTALLSCVRSLHTFSDAEGTELLLQAANRMPMNANKQKTRTGRLFEPLALDSRNVRTADPSFEYVHCAGPSIGRRCRGRGSWGSHLNGFRPFGSVGIVNWLAQSYVPQIGTARHFWVQTQPPGYPGCGSASTEQPRTGVGHAAPLNGEMAGVLTEVIARWITVVPVTDVRVQRISTPGGRMPVTTRSERRRLLRQPLASWNRCRATTQRCPRAAGGRPASACTIAET